MAIGPKSWQDGHEFDSPAKVNEIVLYKKWGGNEIKIEGKDYLLIKFEDVMAIESK